MFTSHDKRTTRKSHIRILEITLKMPELDKLRGMEGVYDVREEIPEKQEALKRWAEFVVPYETIQHESCNDTNTKTLT